MTIDEHSVSMHNKTEEYGEITDLVEASSTSQATDWNNNVKTAVMMRRIRRRLTLKTLRNHRQRKVVWRYSFVDLLRVNIEKGPTHS